MNTKQRRIFGGITASAQDGTVSADDSPAWGFIPVDTGDSSTCRLRLEGLAVQWHP